MRTKYRIALLVDEFCVPTFVRDLACWASNHPRVELAAIISLPVKPNRLNALLTFETRFFSRASDYRRYTELHPIEDLGAMKIALRNSDLLATEERASLEELNLDALVRCGQGLPGREIIGAAKDGLIAIMTTADGAGNGSPAGFGEAFEGRIETPFTIDRLAESGTRETLFRGSIATALLCSWTMISLQARAFPYLRTIVEECASGRANVSATESESPAPANCGNILGYALRTAGRSFHKALRRGSGKEFTWQVAFSKKPWGALDFCEGTVLPNPRNCFLADPFTICVDGVDYLFVEEFPFDTRKGVIAAYCFDNGEPRRIGVVLEENHHLSFPFVFQHEGEIYMVPEAGGDRSVTLYRAKNFPCEWVKEKVLLSDVAAVDTILFKHESRWWMFTTIQGEGPALNNAELYAFYATDPLGEWTPHKANPVVMNATKGRNGGFLRDSNGTACRVAQVPGFTFYGTGSAVYRIDELTPETYRETLVREVEPTFFPGLSGTHHIHSSGSLTVYDFLRVERPKGHARPGFGNSPASLATIHRNPGKPGSKRSAA